MQAGAAGGLAVQADEGIDRLALQPHAQVDVGKFREARGADQAQLVALAHLLALPHHQGIAPEVAVMGLPAGAMVDGDGIAAAPAGDRRMADKARVAVQHAVADAHHGARGGGHHGHAVVHDRIVADGDVDPRVAVVGMGPAGVVLGAGARFMVHMIDQPAGLAQAAGDRQAERRRRRFRRQGRAGRRIWCSAEQQGPENRHGGTAQKA